MPTYRSRQTVEGIVFDGANLKEIRKLLPAYIVIFTPSWANVAAPVEPYQAIVLWDSRGRAETGTEYRPAPKLIFPGTLIGLTGDSFYIVESVEDFYEPLDGGAPLSFNSSAR